VQLKALASGVGRQLLGIISSRVSPELATLLGSFAQQLATTVDEELSARINNAGDRDVVDLVCGFASEVRNLAGGRDLILGLDDGDHLDESDRRRLSDLASSLPDGVNVRVAYSTWSAQTRDEVDELAQHGVAVFELEGLDESAIREWLIAADLPGDWAAQVRRTTNGYALHVAAALDLLAETRSISALDGMNRRDVIGAATRRLWRELDAPSKVAAQRLCAFPAPLNAAEAADFLGVELTIWHTLERSLVDSRVFAGHPPWFHELRRRYVLSEVLEDAERDEVLTAAIQYRGDQLALPDAPPEAFVEYARLTARHASLLERDPVVAAVVAANRDEVAIAGALIELSQPSPAALLADSVLLYAHDVFGATGDLAAALQRIGERGFVHIASNAYATVLVPTWGTIEVLQLFSGRAAAELGRLPTPQLATVVFETALRSKLGEFRSGQYGMGSPRISELSRQATQLQRIQPDGSLVFGKLGPNLLLRYKYDSMPLYAALAYDDESDRDAAAERLEGLKESSSDHSLDVVDCLISPVDCVPSLRFFLAMERLRGTSLVNATSGPPSHPPKLDVPISLEDEMRLRALTLDTVRGISTTVERLAASLEFPIGYLYRGTEESSEAIHVIGRTGASRLRSSISVEFGSPFYRVELAQAAELEPGQRLGLIKWHQGVQQSDPVLHELLWVFQQTAQFNEHQRRVMVKLGEEELSAAIAATSTRTARDALTFMSATEFEISEDDLRKRGLEGSKTCVAVHLDKPDPHWVPAAHATLTSATVANESGEHTAEVTLLSSEEVNPFRGASFNEVRTAFADRFGVDPTDVDRMTHGVAINTLAELLGHRTSEVRFEY
jgi:hypothetical protein